MTTLSSMRMAMYANAATSDPTASDVVGLRLRDRLCYGMAVGSLIAALWFCADALAVAAWGRRISWIVLAIMAVGNVTLGSIGGGCVSFVYGATLRRRAAAHSFREAIRHVCFVGCASVIAIMFVERITHGGYDVDFGRSVGLLPLVAGLVVGGALLLVTSRFGVRCGSSRYFAWNVVSLLLFCILWKPFNELYDTRGVGVTSIAANAFYFVMAICVHLAGRRIGGLFTTNIGSGTTRLCLRSAVAVLVFGMTLSSAVLWWRTPGPHTTVASTVGVTAKSQAEDRSNVILIVMDTVRADHLSLYGYERNTTPNLSQFARDGIVFRNAIAPSSWTIPSHASMFTGLMPSEHGARISATVSEGNERTFPRLASEYQTLAEVLSASGYETAAIVSNLTLSKEAGMAQGFEYYDNRERIAVDTAMCRTLSPAQWMLKAFQRYVFDFDPRHDVYDFCRNAGEITPLVYDWIGENRERPFFLFVNYMDAHNPFHPHPELATQLVRSDRSGSKDLDTPSPLPIAADHREDAENYDAEIAYLDAHLGALFDYLGSQNLLSETLVIVTSDHGEAFGEHGQVGHCKSLYGEEIHVPLIVRYPRGAGGPAEDRRFTSLASLMPLILEHVGIAHPIDGQPGEPDDESFVLAELRRSPHEPDIRSLHTQGGMKAIIGMFDRHEELYDLRSDPFETVDLASQRMDFAQWASSWLDEWGAEALMKRRSEDTGFVMDDAMLQKLRALGYVE